jgi:hypothetical protein
MIKIRDQLNPLAYFNVYETPAHLGNISYIHKCCKTIDERQDSLSLFVGKEMYYSYKEVKWKRSLCDQELIREALPVDRIH